VRSFATLTARTELRRLWQRRSIGRMQRGGDVSEKALVHVDCDGREALGRLRAVLDRINAQDRTLFVLRFVYGFDLLAIAAASGASLATTKRRLARARSRVILFVERDPILSEYLGGERRPDRRPRAARPRAAHLGVSQEKPARFFL
jgi:DNA-directed RNA polymerase specialized sigma24 family protein